MKKITYLCFAVFFSFYNICDAQIQRVRIDFVSPDKYTRHLLLAFTPNNAATDGFDYGYDGPNPDNFLNDLNWMIDGKRYVIQGVGAFDETKQYPFGLFLADSGDIEIALTALENFDSVIDVFIYDSFLDTYTQINTANFKMNIEANVYLNRFFIAFKGADEIEIPVKDEIITLLDDEIITPADDEIIAVSNEEIIDQIKAIESPNVNYLAKTNEIYIRVPEDVEVKRVYIVNLLGQTINSWNALNADFSNNFKIPVMSGLDGIYLIRVETTENIINKKILVKHQ